MNLSGATVATAATRSSMDTKINQQSIIKNNDQDQSFFKLNNLNPRLSSFWHDEEKLKRAIEIYGSVLPRKRALEQISEETGVSIRTAKNFGSKLLNTNEFDEYIKELHSRPNGKETYCYFNHLSNNRKYYDLNKTNNNKLDDTTVLEMTNNNLNNNDNISYQNYEEDQDDDDLEDYFNETNNNNIQNNSQYQHANEEIIDSYAYNTTTNTTNNNLNGHGKINYKHLNGDNNCKYAFFLYFLV
jgi:hypothetical protein